MARHARSKREEARRLYLTGDAPTVAEVARRLDVKPHTVGQWRREERWDELQLKIDRRAAEKLVEELATERVELNSQHFKFWGVVVSRLFSSIQQQGLKLDEIRALERVAAILDRAQRGQRLARGLSLDGQTEEQIRAQAAADTRSLVDVFFDVVREAVPDEETRDEIARALMERCPQESSEATDGP